MLDKVSIILVLPFYYLIHLFAKAKSFKQQTKKSLQTTIPRFGIEHGFGLQGF